MIWHFFVQNGIHMHALSHGKYLGSHPSDTADSTESRDEAQIQSYLSRLEDAGRALDAPIVQLTFDLRGRRLHRYGLRFHDLTIRVKLIEVVRDAPAFLVCLGMPQVSVEYDDLAARVASLFINRLMDFRDDASGQSANVWPGYNEVLRALLEPGRTIEDESFQVKINDSAVARDPEDLTALPVSAPGWSQPSSLKFKKQNASWPVAFWRT